MMIRTLAMARHFGDTAFFHPHLISSHYHSRFMGEETEAQTSEEKYSRLSAGTEIQIQVWTAKSMHFVFYHACHLRIHSMSLPVPEQGQGEQMGLQQAMVVASARALVVSGAGVGRGPIPEV